MTTMDSASLPGEPESGSCGPRCWKPDEDELLRQAVKKYGPGKWALAANSIPGRSNHQCRQRWFFYLDPKINKDPLTDQEYEIILQEQARIGNRWIDIARLLPGRTYCFISDTWYNSIRRKLVRYLAEKRAIGKLQVPCSEDGRFDFREGELDGALAFVLSKVNRSKTKLQRWSPGEDKLLNKAVRDFGADWVKVASTVPGRSNRQCRLRWANHLDPKVNKEPLSDSEYGILIKAHASLGNKWADIVRCLPGRTDEFIKYNWCNKVFGKIVKYLMKKRAVDKGQILCKKEGSFDYQDGELEGAILFVLSNVKKPFSAGKRSRPSDDETSHSDESELPKAKRTALPDKGECQEVATSPTDVSVPSAHQDSQEEKNRRKHRSWSTDEDDLLRNFVLQHSDDWSTVSSLIPGRSKQQCSYRWTRHLDPNISKVPFTSQEYRVFLEAHTQLGNKWVDIAKVLPGRTPSCICNLWNSSVRRKLVTYLATSRGINKSEVQSEDDGRLSYQGDEFEGALSYVVASTNQDPKASKKSPASDDDEVSLVSDVTSYSEANDDSLKKWNLKPIVGTAVRQLLRMRQGNSLSSWDNDETED